MRTQQPDQRDMVLETGDGYPLAATLFEPVESSGRSLVVGSALGVPRYIYSKFAAFMAGRGYTVLTFDYRGIHESRKGNVSGSEMKMEHWGLRDIEAALAWITRNRPGDMLGFVGHSCGGQLLGLAPHVGEVEALLQEYSAARIERREVSPGELGLDSVGHFGFFKEKCREKLWTEAADWLDRQLDARTR